MPLPEILDSCWCPTWPKPIVYYGEAKGKPDAGWTDCVPSVSPSDVIEQVNDKDKKNVQWTALLVNVEWPIHWLPLLTYGVNLMSHHMHCVKACRSVHYTTWGPLSRHWDKWYRKFPRLCFVVNWCTLFLKSLHSCTIALHPGSDVLLNSTFWPTGDFSSLVDGYFNSLTKADLLEASMLVIILH